MARSGDTTARGITAATRRLQAVELRKSGASYRDIGKSLGISHQAAFGLVDRALKDLNRKQQHATGELRAMELERLDMVQFAIWTRATDSPAHLPSIDRLLRLMERRARLLGLDQRPLNEDDDADISGAEAARLLLGLLGSAGKASGAAAAPDSTAESGAPSGSGVQG